MGLIDAISKQAVLEMAYDMSEIDGEHFTEPCMVVDVEDIQKLPFVKLQEPKTGHWIKDNPFTKPYCSECKTSCVGLHGFDYTLTNFCPNCGADMRGEKNEVSD